MKAPRRHRTPLGLERAYCLYCKRQLTPAEPERSTSFTTDHVVAECRGGLKTVPCCRACNHLKGDLSVEDWAWFTATHPRWWKTYDTHGQVKRTIREFRFAQAMARKRDARRYGT